MSERIQPKLLVEGSASNRSLEEQQRLMDEFDTATYESGIDDVAYEEAMAKREYEKNVAIEGRIMDNVVARHIYMMAQNIAELKAKGSDKVAISEKEDKLQELLIAYSDTASANRDTENRNAEQERDTVKGNRIRIGKQIAAEEAHVERTEEVDFILNATEGVRAKAPVVDVVHDNEVVSETQQEKSESEKANSKEDTPFTEADQAELNEMIEQEDNYVPKHSADNQDEDALIFDQLKEERGESDEAAREGESLEEYNARQSAKNGGSHRLEKTSTDGLDLTDTPSTGKHKRASVDGLDIIDTPAADVTGEALVEQDSKAKLSWRDRLRRLATPSGLAAELSASMHYSKEKLVKHKKAAIGLGILAVAGSVAAVYFSRDTGGSTGGSPRTGNGGGLADLLLKQPGGGHGGHDAHNATTELLNSSAWNIPKGSGGEALMGRLGADKSVWYEHQDQFLKLFPNEGYRMSDGNVGFDDPGRLSKAAVKFWSDRVAR